MGSIREQERPPAAEHVELVSVTKPKDAEPPQHSDETQDSGDRRKHQCWFFVEWQVDRRCD